MVFRSLYKRRLHSLYGQYMSPEVFEEKIVPIVPRGEMESLRQLVISYFPGLVIARATQNDLIAFRNDLNRILKETSDKPKSTE